MKHGSALGERIGNLIMISEGQGFAFTPPRVKANDSSQKLSVLDVRQVSLE